MLVAIEGIDGAGKTTFLDQLYDYVVLLYCKQEKIKLRRSLQYAGQYPNFYSNKNWCCEEKCVIRTKQSDFNASLNFFDKTIKASSIKTNSYLDYVKSFNPESDVFYHLFYLGLFHVSSLVKKNKNSIVLSDRFQLSALAYTYGIEQLKSDIFPKGTEEIFEGLKNHCSKFNWNLLPFAEEEIRGYLHFNDIVYTHPFKTFFLGVTPEVCVKNISERREREGKSTGLTVYDSMEQLKQKWDRFQYILEFAREGEVSVLETSDIRSKQSILQIAYGLVLNKQEEKKC